MSILFSACQNNGLDNLNHKQLARRLSLLKIPFKTDYSRYAGKNEIYIQVNDEYLTQVIKFCKEFNQESYLSLVDDKAIVHDVRTLRVIKSGRWVQIDYDLNQLDFTLVNNKMFIIK